MIAVETNLSPVNLTNLSTRKIAITTITFAHDYAEMRTNSNPMKLQTRNYK